MTTNEIVAYYQNLLIIQYLGKLKASGTIGVLVTPIIMDQLPNAVQNAFNLDTAIGVQLDVIGKYIGVVRNGNGLRGQPITLDDSDFRALIRIGIIKNMSGSSLATIQALIHQYFPNEFFVYDPQDMQMSYLISASVGTTDLVEMFITQNLLPKPMGVQLASLIYLQTLEIFGMQDYNLSVANIFPFNDYDDYQTTWHWLNYDDTITII